MYSFRNFYSLSPAYSRSLTHIPHLFTNPFISLLQRVVASHNHIRTPCFIPLTHQSVPLLLSHLHSIHIPHTHNHSIHNTIQSFPFTRTHSTTPNESLSLMYWANFKLYTASANLDYAKRRQVRLSPLSTGG